MRQHDAQSKGQFEPDEASPEWELACLSQQSDKGKNRQSGKGPSLEGLWSSIVSHIVQPKSCKTPL